MATATNTMITLPPVWSAGAEEWTLSKGADQTGPFMSVIVAFFMVFF
jgi:hypothetical protein